MGLLTKLHTGLSGVPIASCGWTAADVAVLFGVILAVWFLAKVAGVVAGFLCGGAKRRIDSYGRWAVVTGASDGIGRAYAEELARRGLDVVIVARSADKLAAAAKEISAATGRTVVPIASDLSKAAEVAALSAKLQTTTADGGIGILVNNAGLSYPSALYLHELGEKAPTCADDHIALNIAALTRLTQAVLPGMLARKRGAIINVGSGYGRIPGGNPFFAIYGASKAYVDYFSQSLAAEYGPKGIHVQCQSPGFVATAMTKQKPSLIVPTPAQYARTAVDAIGSGASVVPYWSHKIVDAAVNILPQWLVQWQVRNMHADINRRYLRKLDREAAAKTAPAASGADSGADPKKKA